MDFVAFQRYITIAQFVVSNITARVHFGFVIFDASLLPLSHSYVSALFLTWALIGY
jgi:hypothetical protein